jgi:hypothetical protein
MLPAAWNDSHGSRGIKSIVLRGWRCSELRTSDIVAGLYLCLGRSSRILFVGYDIEQTLKCAGRTTSPYISDRMKGRIES